MNVFFDHQIQKKLNPLFQFLLLNINLQCLLSEEKEKRLSKFAIER